jgi:His/Glu/Gln/Arg/opine family amino acid ABC transporter permease subunit
MIANFEYYLALTQGIAETLSLASVSLLLGLGLGIVFSYLETRNIAWLSQAILSLGTLLRGIPEILLLFAVFFGGSWALSKLCNDTIEIQPWFAGVFALSITFASYAAKLFSAGFRSISAGEQEAAQSLGLKPTQSFYHIYLPQIFRYALPGLGSLWLILLKDTALISLIGGQDLLSRFQIIIRNTNQPFTYYFILAAIYLILTTVSSYLGRYISKSLNKHQHNKHINGSKLKMREHYV